MNKKIPLTLSILLLLALHVNAKSKELDKLKAANKEAIEKENAKFEQKLKLIDKAYLKKLEAMMQHFMKEADLDGALAVRKELKIFKATLGLPDKPEGKTKNKKVASKQESAEQEPQEKKSVETDNDKAFGEEEF